jgi:hypothetical protein
VAGARGGSNDVGIAFSPGGTVLATTQTDEDGAPSTKITIPAGLSGKYTLVAVGYKPKNDRLDAHELTLPITLRR